MMAMPELDPNLESRVAALEAQMARLTNAIAAMPQPKPRRSRRQSKIAQSRQLAQVKLEGDNVVSLKPKR